MVLLGIIMLSLNFFCNISSYDILAYHKESYSVDIIWENSTSIMPVSRGEGFLAVCQAIYS
jgi:hypothetical protein